MKVLAVVASARKTGNSEILAKAMLAALPASTEKQLLKLSELRIEPCRACYACLPAGAACVIQDDFESFLGQVREADAVILASPVYFLGMHTRLKLLCDRLIRVLNESGTYRGRRCVVAVPYGVRDWQGYGVEATVTFARFLHLDVVGVLPVHAANPGEAADPETLRLAAEMALRLLPESGAACPAPVTPNPSRQTTDPEDIVCGFCGSGLLRVGSCGGLRCALCGAQRSLEVGVAAGTEKSSGGWTLPEAFRFSAAGMAEHAHRLESIKAEFLRRRHELAELRKPFKD